jgi:hypothetical protein
LIYRSNGGNQSINCNGTGAGALGQQEQQEQQEAREMVQRHCDHCHCDRSIDRVDVGRGRGRVLFRVLIEKISECPNGGPIKGVTYLVDYFD